MTYYIKGGSKYNEANPKVWTALFLGGFPDADYPDADWKSIDYGGHITTKDPYWRFGSSSGGAQTAEFGLYDDYRIEIDETNGVRAWNGSDWVNLLDTEVGAHTHDGDTLELDGINSDGGAFPFTTSGDVTFSQNIIGPVIAHQRITNTTHGISWYNIAAHTTWSQYMAQAAQNNVGPTGNLTAPAGTLVTSWALRSYIEQTAGFGWTWEKGTNADTTPTVVFEIRSSDGSFKSFGSGTVVGTLTAATLTGTTTINAPTGASASYWNANDLYASQHIRVRDGHKFLGYSVGNDKNIQMYHDDTRGWLTTPSGDGDIKVQPGGTYLYVYPGNGVGGYVRFSAAAGWLTMFGSNNFWVDSNNILYLKADSTIQINPNHASGVAYNFTNGLMYPTGHKTEDCGMVFNAWDEAYADNWNNVGARYIEKAGLYERYKAMEIVPHSSKKTSVGDAEIDAGKLLTEITQPDRYEKQYKRKFVGYVAEVLKRTPEEVDSFVRENYINREDCPEPFRDNWRPRPEDLKPEDYPTSLNQWIVVNSIIIQDLQNRNEALENRIKTLEEK